jgi:hypothetical protein
MPLIGIAAKNRELTVTLGDRPVEQGYRFLSTYELDGKDGKAFLEERLKRLPESERGRCIVRPYPESAEITNKAWPNLYEIAPNPAYMAEILARNEPAAACGEQGWTNDGIQFWELRDGEAWFWELGQEAPLYDPRSFTMLRKGADSSWGLADSPSVPTLN